MSFWNRMLSLWLAVGAVAYLVLLAFAEPRKGGPRWKRVTYGVAVAMTFATGGLAVALRGAGGMWWWLGVSGTVLGFLCGLAWAVWALVSSPGTAGELQLRPWSLVLLLLCDAAFLGAVKLGSGPVAWLLFALAAALAALFLRVAWRKRLSESSLLRAQG
ncbi:MAG: hypothetical protein ACP5NF_07120 [Thermoanaerobaculum sp.]